MGIFKLTAACGYLILRARCISCARGIAGDAAGSEGPRVWRDPARSKIEVLTNTTHQPEGPVQILERHMQ